MGKAGKWIKSFLVGGKKDRDKEKEKEKEKEKHTSTNHPSSTAVTENPVTPVVITPATPKEKKRWSFRRSSATAPGPKDSSSNESTPTKTGPPPTSESPDSQQKKPELPAAAEAQVADVTMTPPEPAADMDAEYEMGRLVQLQDAAATKIQSVFRSYLARKALRALRGLVKLQALVRGHLVRKQATATLRCMQALVTAQARARAQRIRSTEEELYANHRHSAHRVNNQDYNFRNFYHEMEHGMMEENIKIVEMDLGDSKGSSKTRSSYSNYHNDDRMDNRFTAHYAPQFDYLKQDYQKISPAPSAITGISPRTCSGHFEDYSFATAQSSPQCYYSAVSRPDPSRTPFAFPRQEEYTEPLPYDHPLYPNYMSNTQSSRAKARSQSAPKQRPDAFERQPSRRRPSVEGRNIPRAVRMQRSSSHVGATAQNYQYPWSIKLDKSTVSLKESECGSTCSVLTNANYCRSLISYDPQGHRYQH